VEDRHFDHLARLLTTAPSRRMALHAVAGLLAATVLGPFGRTGAAAKKRKKRKNRKKRKKPTQTIKLNAFGCVDVGDPCRGNNGLCCSGICEGDAPEPGAPDTSRCMAHDTGGCLPGVDSCDEPVPCPSNPTGPTVCNQTTGKAAYCNGVAHCGLRCQTDDDCREFCNDEAAACLHCPTGGCGGFGPTFCATPTGCKPPP
jgi:hypothetical protein